MSALLFTAVLALVPAEADDGPKLDGKWLVVYAEEGGRRNNAWEQRLATLKEDTLTYEDAGKTRSVQLKFGQNQTVEATRKGEGDNEKTFRGVYIAGRDYLCLSLEAAKEKKRGDHQSSGDFILILRKQVAR